MTSFADFEIWIGQVVAVAANGGYPVQVVSSPAGSASGTLKLNMLEEEFSTDLNLVRGVTGDPELREDFGSRLFNALFDGDVRRVWDDSKGRLAERPDEVLRLRLWIVTPELAMLPWELLCDNHRFLATSSNMVLSRYLPVPEPPVLVAQEQLRVLLVVQSPDNLEQVPEEEVTGIKQALNALGNVVSYTVSHNESKQDIQQRLQQGYQVLHFLGHGTGGELMLRGDDGKAETITDRQFAQLFLGRRELRLVVLTACYSSQNQAGPLFSGVGPSLVQQGVPAVIAMQYPSVYMTTAGTFSQALYKALANGLAVDSAVNEGRQLLSAGPLLEKRDWSTPVLYMGTRAGRLLSITNAQTNTVERAWHTVHAAAQGSDEARAALAELAQSFREVAGQQSRLKELNELAEYLRVLRAAIGRCVTIVDAAKGEPSKLKIVPLQEEWIRMRDDALPRLETFLNGHDGLDATQWLAPLQDCRARIDRALGGAYKDLLDGIPRCAQQIAQAAILVDKQRDEQIDALVALSERTLGRLELA